MILLKHIIRISRLIPVILSIFLIFSCKKDKPEPPVITTTAVSAISYTTATSGGMVTNEGGAPVTARGVCWNTSADPTTANNKTANGTGSGSFTSSLSGLTAGTTYYVRAYATNIAGTGYGSQVTLTTVPLSVPVLTTTAISSITQTTAVSGGNITTDNGSSVTARGVCWGTEINPTTSNSKTSDAIGTGLFTSTLTGLTGNTTYYVRAYATNSMGTEYGNQVIITTSSVLPSLTTVTVSSITAISATGGGVIVNDGGATVTARGICWSTSQSPTISDRKTSDGGGIGTFTSNMTGLNGNTTYYVRAYATNSQGTAYGNEVNFKTNLVLSQASLTTSNPSSITSSSALLGGNISFDGNATVTERGVCYSTSQTPTTGNTKIGLGTGIGTFSTTVSGLTSNTTYYVRAYAINSQGTAYGNELNFKTNIVISDSIKDADMVCDDTPNTLQNILDDMSLSNEGHPNGINPSWSWYSGPDVKNPAPFPGNALNGWGVVYRKENSALPANTRIQIKYVKTYYLSKSDNLWHQVQGGFNLEGRWFREYIENDPNGISSNQRNESIGISGNPIAGYCFHFWDSPRGSINPTEIKGTFVTISARLIVDNPNLPDDKTSSRFLLEAGADYYPDMNNVNSTNIGEGRFKYVKTGWRCFNFCSLSQTEILNNPPPLN